MGELDHIYQRQLGYFNPENQKFNIRIFGAGSIGSFLTLSLAKLGFSDIKVYDFDTIEEHNIPNQFYKVGDIGSPKVVALHSIVKEFTGTEISFENIKLDKDNVGSILGDINIDSLVILAFDNLEARGLVFSELLGFPNYLIDFRMGGLGYEVICIKLDSDNECKEFETSLNKETKDLPCGQQSVIYCILSLVSEGCQMIVQLNNGGKCATHLRRELNNYLIINNLNKV